MVRKKIKAKIQQDPVSIIIIILVFITFLAAALVYVHLYQAAQIKQLRRDVDMIRYSSDER